MRSATLILCVIFLVGCSQTRNYRVTLRNATGGPITFGLVKDGPPLEPRWTSPEEWTDIPPSRRPSHWGNVLKTGDRSSAVIPGTFAAHTNALLRIYLGDKPVDDLLAMSRGFGDRTEVRLSTDSDNDFTIEAPGGRIVARLTRLTPRNPAK